MNRGKLKIVEIETAEIKECLYFAKLQILSDNIDQTIKIDKLPSVKWLFVCKFTNHLQLLIYYDWEKI